MKRLLARWFLPVALALTGAQGAAVPLVAQVIYLDQDGPGRDRTDLGAQVIFLDQDAPGRDRTDLSAQTLWLEQDAPGRDRVDVG
jgi:hypothetical protein